MTLTEIVGWSLVHSLWVGMVISGLLFLLLRFVDERRASLRYGASCAALLILVGVPIGAACRMAPDAPAESSRLAEPVDADTDIDFADAGAASSPGKSDRQQEAESVVLPAPDSWQSTEADQSSLLALRLRPLLPWMVLLWVIGVGILSARLLATWIRVQRLRTRGTAQVDAPYAAALDRILRRLAISRPVQLLQSTVVQVPAVIGWLSPVVLIPVTLLNGLTIAQLEAILAHELAHIRRHDYLINLIQVVIETLLFYHPAAWWISRQVRETREHCCDDLAVQVAGNPADYARALLALEESRVLALLPAATGGDLLSRVRRLVAPPVSHAETFPRWVAALVGVAAVVVLGGGTGLAAKSNPAAASFEEPAVQVPMFSRRNAPVSADTVIKHPDPSAPLAQRWQWARDMGATNRYQAFWVGYSIDPMPGLKGSVFISRLERRGIVGSGGIDLRGRITNFGGFENFSIPGVPLQPLMGGRLDDVAMLFAFAVDAGGTPVLVRVHISSLSLPVDLEDRPVLWLGPATDEQSVPLVLSLYQDAPTRLKEDLIAAVGIHGEDRLAVPPLVRWLNGDEPTDIRTEAAEWLGRHPDPEALRVLARVARNDRSGDVRREAAESVADVRLNEASDTLIVLARTLTDTEARQEAVEGLAERDDARSLAAAGRIARDDPSRDIRQEAVETLGEFSNGAGLPDLIQIIKSDPSSDIRQEAVETIAETAAPEEAIRILNDVIRTERQENVLREAVETIGDIESPKAVATLRELAAGHSNRWVRIEAVETLGQMDAGPDIAELLHRIAVQDADKDVQAEAVETLGELPSAIAIPALIDVARNHPNPEIRAEAVETLGESQGDDRRAVEAITAIARNDRSQRVSDEAVETLGEMGTSEALDVVAEVASKHSDPEVRRQAGEAIGQSSDHDWAIQKLMQIARDGNNAEVQQEAVETLGEVEDPRVVGELIDLARTHPNEDVRAEAIETLTEIEISENVINSLSAIAMTDPSVDIGERALEALGELDDDRGIPAVIKAARSHPNRELRQKALEILSESDSPTAQALIDSILR